MITLGLIFGLIVISKNDNPTLIITWLFLILGAPIFGIFAYLFIKIQPQFKLIKKRYEEKMQETKGLLKNDPTLSEALKKDNKHVYNLIQYMHRNCGTIAADGAGTTYFESGEKQFEKVKEDMKNAKKFIFIETFIISYGELWTEIQNILEQKAKEGIEIRLLYDGTCTFNRLPVKFPEMMKKKGINCKVFAPIIPVFTTYQNNRDHRKIIVIDGKIAYTGGTNFADEYVGKEEPYGKWKDSAIRITGNAVNNFTLFFLRTWNMKEKERENYSNYIMPTKPFSENHDGIITAYAENPYGSERIGENVYIDMIASANTYVHIMTPYLIPSYEMMRALTFAAKRGVDVKIIMPHTPDKRSAFWVARTYYSYLIKNGVKIYEWLPGFVHAKIFVVDGIQATVGSINLDYRSLYLHLECSSYLYKNSEIKNIEKDYRKNLNNSMIITQKFLNDLPLHQKLIGKILRFFAPLL